MDIKPTKPSLSQEASNALRAESGFSDWPSLMSQFTIRTMAGDLKNAAAQSQAAAKLTAAKTISPPAAPRGERSELYGAAPREQFYAAAPRDYLKIVPPPKEIVESKTASFTAPPLPKAEEEQAKKEKEAQGKKKQEQKAAAKEAARAAKKKLSQAQEAQKQELRGIFEQAKLKLAAKEFDAAIIDAQKIIASPASGWLTKWRAQRLINKAQKGTTKKEAELQTSSDFIRVIPPTAPSAVPRSEQSKPYEGERKELYGATAQPKSAAVPVNLPTVEEIPAAKPIQTIPPTAPSAVPRSEQSKLYGGEQNEPYAAAPRGERSELYGAFPAKPSFQMPAGLLPGLLETKTAEPEEVLDMKKVALIGLVAIAVLALIVWGLWFFLKQPSAPPQISQTPSPRPSLATQTPLPTPTSLFKTDSQKIFALKTGQEKASFQEALAQLALTDEPAGNFTFLLFKDSASQYPSLYTIAALAGFDLFNLPTQNGTSTLKDQLDTRRFSFFVYSQAADDSSPFLAQANVGRLGLIVKTQGAVTPDQLVKSLRDLEQLMPADLKLLLADAKNRLPASPIFTDSLYQNIPIRYINFPTPDLSLDYAVLNDYLIFGTSKESLRAAIDRILGQ